MLNFILLIIFLEAAESKDDAIGNINDEKLDKIATDYEKTDGFAFNQNQLNFAV